MSDDPARDPARDRWMAMQAARWTGLAVFVIGLLIYAGRIALPEEAGYALIAIGIVATLFLPTVLARKWRSRP